MLIIFLMHQIVSIFIAAGTVTLTEPFTVLEAVYSTVAIIGWIWINGQVWIQCLFLNVLSRFTLM